VATNDDSIVAAGKIEYIKRCVMDVNYVDIHLILLQDFIIELCKVRFTTERFSS
jgi:hypothetical protein